MNKLFRLTTIVVTLAALWAAGGCGKKEEPGYTKDDFAKRPPPPGYGPNGVSGGNPGPTPGGVPNPGPGTPNPGPEKTGG